MIENPSELPLHSQTALPRPICLTAVPPFTLQRALKANARTTQCYSGLRERTTQALALLTCYPN